ncbi:hypothetical protein LZ31DRAFT_160347 [Colletotrichum somersetense]|nr:hypothetical protein LZ31DRAFT_160347 [Colletotrichum somersetense]
MRVSPIVDFIFSELYSEYRHRNNLEDEFEPRRPEPVEYGKYNYSYENSTAIRAVPGSPSSQDESIKSPAVSSDAILHVVVEQVPIRDGGSDPLRPQELPKARPYTRLQNSIAGLQGVAAQWKSGSAFSNDDGEAISCRLESYDFVTSWVHRHPAEAFNQKPWIIHSDHQSWPSQYCGHLVRHVKLSQSGSNYVKAHIICEAFASTTCRHDSANVLSHTASTERFITELRQLDNEYTGVQKPDNIRQVFMLQIYHAHLKAYAAFLEEFEASYTSPRKRLFFNPQYSQLRSWTMKAIISDSIIYNQLASSAKDITATCESLLEIVTAMKGEPGSRLFWIAADIRGCCREVTARLAGMSEDLQHQLDLLNLSWNVNQSQNVKILTLLATVFLPLSLSAGILGMGTRFKDLGDLMYDFIGVVVLLGALVLVILLLFSFVAFLQELESRLRPHTWYWTSRQALKKLGALIFTTLGGLVLVSFVIGMFKEVSLGGRILGYGLAIMVGILLCLMMLAIVCVVVMLKFVTN